MKKRVKPDIAYDYIRTRILTGEFLPGHALRTEFLSRMIGVSRTPVTEALRKLHSIGLVTMRNGQGAQVREMGVKEFRETCDLRMALEGHAAGLAALHHDEKGLAEILRALDAMRKLTDRITATESEDQSVWADLANEDVRFHIAIMTAAKNDLMKQEILRLHLINRVVVGQLLATQIPVSKAEADADRRSVLASHEEIYTAIAKRDVTAAKLAMERHIQNIVDKNMMILKRGDVDVSDRELTSEELIYSNNA